MSTISTIILCITFGYAILNIISKIMYVNGKENLFTFIFNLAIETDLRDTKGSETYLLGFWRVIASSFFYWFSIFILVACIFSQRDWSERLIERKVIYDVTRVESGYEYLSKDKGSLTYKTKHTHIHNVKEEDVDCVYLETIKEVQTNESYEFWGSHKIGDCLEYNLIVPKKTIKSECNNETY